MPMFLHLMKGRYDGDLRWPLIGTFEIALLNQKMYGKHYIGDGHPVKFTSRTPLTSKMTLSSLEYVSFDKA